MSAVKTGTGPQTLGGGEVEAQRFSLRYALCLLDAFSDHHNAQRKFLKCRLIGLTSDASLQSNAYTHYTRESAISSLQQEFG
jgi:hypothetical protein